MGFIISGGTGENPEFLVILFATIIVVDSCTKILKEKTTREKL